MVSLPHGTTDLLLAPVVLAIDERLQELGKLEAEELKTQVALVSNAPDWSRRFREIGLLATIRYLIDSHGWDLSWDPRGLRVAHGERGVVLGLPPTLTAYLDGSH